MAPTCKVLDACPDGQVVVRHHVPGVVEPIGSTYYPDVGSARRALLAPPGCAACGDTREGPGWECPGCGSI